MALWNSTKIVNAQISGASGDGSWRPHGNVYNASGDHANVRAAWEWNVTIPQGLPGSAFRYKLDDRVVGSSFNRTHVATWALSLKEGQVGQILFNKVWNAPTAWNAGNQTISRSAGSIDGGIITYWSKETNQHWAFSTNTGDLLWGPTAPQDYLDLFGHRAAIAYDKFFSQGMSGILYCYDAKTGQLLWTYEASDPYNQVLWANQWHIRPLIIVDGKIYMGTSEHSPVDPKPKGGPFVCVDVETGQEIWRADGLFRQTDWGARAIIGDSIIATMDTYDQRIYAIGRGPSATTITTSAKSMMHGSDVLIEGRVTDISPGTKSSEITMRFPHGVPAVADSSMSDWMLYVYKQFPRPMDAIGVEVMIDVVDANGNYRNIGTTTSDADGFFSFNWTPDIEGKYTVYASFSGTKSYWPSHAITTFNVNPTAATPAPTQQITPGSAADTYLLPGIIAIIIAIAIVGALILLAIKKRP
jgi:hypothetical protein